MSYSQFDANTAFSGGGFMTSQSTQSTEFSPSVSKNRDGQGLFPLTVKQMSQAYDSSDDKSSFVVDGVDVKNITIVGIVSNKIEQATAVTFTVDDGTGRIECRRWVQEAHESREMEQIQEGIYVRVHGHLNGFKGKQQLVVFSVRPVTDFNEIAFHFIECVYVHVYNIKAHGGGQTQLNVTNSASGTNGSVGHPGLATNQFFVQNRPEEKKLSIGERVLQYLGQPAPSQSNGIHVDELARQLRVPKETIMATIPSLEAEGLVYSTIDHLHYKSIMSG